MAAYPLRAPAYVTREEYIERERHAETASEYWDGVIVNVAGPTLSHTQIVLNIGARLHAALQGRTCQALPGMRVRVAACNDYFYPDISVVCGRPEMEDHRKDTLLNPVLVIEVLSESTEARDRGDKLICYETLPSLSTYLMVSQVKPHVDVYRREGDRWYHEPISGLEAVVPLPSAGCELPLASIYDRVDLTPQAEPETRL
jgi:Uma2 family endonuclease